MTPTSPHYFPVNQTTTLTDGDAPENVWSQHDDAGTPGGLLRDDGLWDYHLPRLVLQFIQHPVQPCWSEEAGLQVQHCYVSGGVLSEDK